MSFLISFLSTLAGWLLTLLVDLPLYVLNLLLIGLATFINDIPVPGFVSSASGYIGSIPALPAFLLSSLDIGSGVAIILGAYVIRFLIRRIPFIG